jgi:hypothetical protein
MVCGPSSPDQPREAGGDLVERDIPRDPLEATAPFGSGSPLGMQDAIWAVDAVDVVVDLHAEPAPCEGIVGVATDLDGAPVLDREERRAGIGAIVRAGAPDDRLAAGCGGRRLLLRSSSRRRGRCERTGEDARYFCHRAVRPARHTASRENLRGSFAALAQPTGKVHRIGLLRHALDS